MAFTNTSEKKITLANTNSPSLMNWFQTEASSTSVAPFSRLSDFDVCCFVCPAQLCCIPIIANRDVAVGERRPECKQCDHEPTHTHTLSKWKAHIHTHMCVCAQKSINDIGLQQAIRTDDEVHVPQGSVNTGCQIKRSETSLGVCFEVRRGRCSRKLT